MDVTELVRAAGGIVARRGPDRTPEVVVVHRLVYGDWTFPKGKADEGESDEDTAVREVVEETNLACRLVRELGTTRYVDARGRPKQVRYWQMEVEAGELEASSEIDDARWLPLDAARDLLTYDRDVALVDALERRRGTVHLVRHAKAKDRLRWTKPDELRPLTKAGRAQSAAIGDRLADVGVARLLSSAATRCVQTLDPLAQATGLEIELVEELAEGSSAKDAMGRLEEALDADGEVVACTHGDVLLDALFELRQSGIPLAGPFEARKASTWVLDVDALGVRSAHYIGPPEA